MNTVYAFVLPFIIYLGICQIIRPETNIEKKDKKIPVIDKNKTYPKKEYHLETEVTYIPLETNKDVLLDRDARIFHISETKILVANKTKGEIFIFGMDGKVVSKFSVKGGLGVVIITNVVYDEPNNEVFILDRPSRKVVVYNDQGTWLRAFRFPSDLIIEEINNFDKNSLLAYHEHLYGPILQKQPYMFISKKDGAVSSKLNINREKANPSVHYENNTWAQIGFDHSGNCKFGDEFILANMSSDTIYLLKQNKSVSPLFIQTPTVFSDPPVIVSVGMKTDDIITFAIYTFDLKGFLKSGTSGRFKSDVRFLTYEFSTGNFYEHKSRSCWVEKADLPRNTGARFIYAHDLIDRSGMLNGQLKKIASKIKLDDNPIIEITKLK
ncbi:MAG: 6-bladed beta-propeller [Mariniphaga sp.]|nr:6-bladed beta-propeller [Mariniphaga sp.]